MADVTVGQSGSPTYDYSSLNAAVGGASSGDTIKIQGAWTANDTTATSISKDLTIQTEGSAKHNGYYNTSDNHYRLRTTGASHSISFSGAYTVTIDGLAISQAGTTSSAEGIRCVPGTSDTATIKNCIVKCENDTADQDCIYTGFSTAVGDITVEQCIIYGAYRGGINTQNNGSSITLNVNSCFITDCGGESDGGGIVAWSGGSSLSDATYNVFNSIVVENDAAGDDFYSGDGDETWNISYCF
jgi:hypothetical protein